MVGYRYRPTDKTSPFEQISFLAPIPLILHVKLSMWCLWELWRLSLSICFDLFVRLRFALWPNMWSWRVWEKFSPANGILNRWPQEACLAQSQIDEQRQYRDTKRLETPMREKRSNFKLVCRSLEAAIDRKNQSWASNGQNALFRSLFDPFWFPAS